MDKSNLENSPLSFFKIFLNESASNLRLPSVFVNKLHLEGSFPENPELEIQTGQKWRVEIERSGERAFFGKGWLDFVKDTKIKYGDFIVFRLIDNYSSFQVYIFDPSGCQKDLSFATPTTCKSSCGRSRIIDADLKDVIRIEEDEDGNINVEKHDDHEVDDEKDIELQPFDRKEKSIGPCFQRVLARFNNRYVELPQGFVRESGLRNEGKTILRNKAGEEWPVGVIQWNIYRVYISRGWINFRRVNKLMEGDTCSFQYFHGEGSQSGFIQVEVVKKAARKRGRPPQIQEAMKRGRPPGTRPGFCSRDDLKDAIKLEEEEEEEDDGDTNVEEFDDDYDHEVDEGNDIELQPFEQKDKSIKPCFQKVLTTSNGYYVELPYQFLLESGLRNAGKTILKNKLGREWPVTIKICPPLYRVYISHGWADYRRVNKLMEGDTCSFRYFPAEGSQSGYIQVEVVKKAARKRGRPPLIRPGSCGKARIIDADLKDVIRIEEDEDGIIDVEEHDDDDEVVKKAARKRGRPPRIQPARKRGRPPGIRPGSHNRNDLKEAIWLEEEDDDGDTNVKEHDDDDDHGVDSKQDIELQLFEGKEKSIKPCFQKVLSAFNAYSVFLPSQFLLESGLRRKTGKAILRNKSGREWPVTVKTCNKRYKVFISHGWVNFRRANKLTEGDTCSFQYFHGDEASQSGFIQVEVVKKEARKNGRHPWIQAARKRGRPPQIRPGKR